VAVASDTHSLHLTPESRQMTMPSTHHSVFSARCNIYISSLCYDVSVCLSVRLSVMEVHWHNIANLGFKLRSKFTAHRGSGEG